MLKFSRKDNKLRINNKTNKDLSETIVEILIPLLEAFIQLNNREKDDLICKF